MEDAHDLALDQVRYHDGVVSSRRAGAQNRPRKHSELEDVRRSACDKCRSQKLRCERDRISLNTPLRSIPCRRCVKAQVHCTTNNQAPVGRGPEDSTYTTYRPQRRQTMSNKQGRARVISPQLVNDSHSDESEDPGDGEDEEENEADTQPKRRFPPNWSPCMSRPPSAYLSGMETVMQAASNRAGIDNVIPTKHSHFDESQIQLLNTFNTPESMIHSKNVPGAHRRSTYTRPVRPEGTKSIVSQQRQQRQQNQAQTQNQNQNQNQSQNREQNQSQGQPVFPTIPNPIPSPIIDVFGGFDEFDMMMEDEFDPAQDMQWAKKPMLDLPPQSNPSNQNRASVTNDSGYSQEVAGFGSGLAKPTSNIHNALSLPLKKVTDDEQCYQEWTQRLALLVKTLMDDTCCPDLISSGSSRSSSISGVVGQGLELPDKGQSPMSRLFWNIEQFLKISGEILSRSRERSNGEIASGNPVSSTTRLSTLMAIFLAYGSILQTYERIFKRIHLSLMGTENDTSSTLDQGHNQYQHQGPSQSLLELLPPLQLDGFMFAPGPMRTVNSLQIHVTMDASLQMLNQAGAYVSSILDAQMCSTDQTRSCLTTLLQSLASKEIGDTVSASQAIRDDINKVRNLFVAKAAFVAGGM